jgi:hypothetical protein
MLLITPAAGELSAEQKIAIYLDDVLELDSKGLNIVWIDLKRFRSSEVLISLTLMWSCFAHTEPEAGLTRLNTFEFLVSL